MVLNQYHFSTLSPAHLFAIRGRWKLLWGRYWSFLFPEDPRLSTKQKKKSESLNTFNAKVGDWVPEGCQCKFFQSISRSSGIRLKTVKLDKFTIKADQYYLSRFNIYISQSDLYSVCLIVCQIFKIYVWSWL